MITGASLPPRGPGGRRARSSVRRRLCPLRTVCGHPPFVGDSPAASLTSPFGKPPTPSDLNPDVTPAIDAIVLKALSKNPLNRYQSAGEMRADLLRAAAGRPVLATPVMREDETTQLAPAAGAAGYPAAGATQTRQIPARVGDPRRQSVLLAIARSPRSVGRVIACGSLLHQRLSAGVGAQVPELHPARHPRLQTKT